MPNRGKYYWYLDGDLHRIIRTWRGKDLLIAWNYPKHQRVTLNYTYVQRNKKKAFTTQEVTKLIGRNRISVQRQIDRGNIPPPQHSYSFETGRMKEYWWSESDIMGLLDYFAGLPKGRPRKNGEFEHTWEDLPTPPELRAAINNEEVLYVKRGDEFIPTWRAPS